MSAVCRRFCGVSAGVDLADRRAVDRGRGVQPRSTGQRRGSARLDVFGRNHLQLVSFPMTTSPGQGQPAASAPPSASDAQGRAPRPSPPRPIMVFFWVQIALLTWDVVDRVATFNSIKARAINTELKSNRILTHDQIVANATNSVVIGEAVAAFFVLLTTFVVFKVKAGRSWARSLVAMLSILPDRGGTDGDRDRVHHVRECGRLGG